MQNLLEEYITRHSSPEEPLLSELYRQTHLKFLNPNMLSGHLQGKLLRFISLMIKPEKILEIGTYTGYSAICLVSGLKKGGKLFTIEINDELKEFSASHFRRAGIEDMIVQITGDAFEVIPELTDQFDLIYIDGNKRDYSGYFNISFPMLKPGGFLIADNVLWGNKVLDPNTKDQQTRGIIDFNENIRKRTDIEKIILPVHDGITLIRKNE